MKKLPERIPLLLIASAVIFVSPAVAANKQDNGAASKLELKNDPLSLAGPLQKIGEVQNLFELKTIGTKLAPEIVSSYQEAQGTVSQIRSQTRSGGGSSSMGNGNWTSYFQGNDFFGHVSKGKVQPHLLARFPNLKSVRDDADFSILFQELSSPQRELLIGVDSNQVFDISLRSSELGYLFRFRQDLNGRIVCREMSPEFLFARSAQSFDEFSRQNPEYVQERLTRVFDFMGIENPPTRYSSIVRKHVLLLLRPNDEDRMERFKKAIERMSASSFQDREAATAEIEKNFKTWEDLIQIGMGDENFAVETRTRLTKIYGNHVSESTRELMKLAQVSKLHLDPEYLIWTLGKTESEADRKLLANQLSKLTGQNLGVDTDKWIAWFADENQTGEVENSPRSRSNEQTGPINSITEFVEQLVKFSNAEGELELDRSHWGRPFDNQPIQESIREVEALMKKKNLPLQWLEAGGKYSPESSQFPQVIFENMAARLEAAGEQKNPTQPTYGYINQPELITRNRFVGTDKITAQMQFHKETAPPQLGRIVIRGNQPALPAAKYFYLYFKERAGAKRTLEIHESENKIISITFMSENADTVIRFVQHPGDSPDIAASRRCAIYDIRTNQTRELMAANFNELCQANSEYLQNDWLPLMKKMGIQIEVPSLESN